MYKHDTACLDRAWPMISDLIHLLLVRVAGLGAGTPARGELFRLTRLAESLVRRWLVLKACQTSEWKRESVRPTRPKRARGGGDGPPKPQTLKRFRLIEPERPMPVFTYQPATQTQPACYVLGPVRASCGAPSRNSPQAFNPANLRRRCDALLAVLSAPEPYVRRMARWLARAANRCGRVIPFRVGWPPGSSRRQRRLDPERIGMLLHLDDLARAAVRRRQHA